MAADGLGTRKADSLTCWSGTGSRWCTQVEADAVVVVVEVVASKTVVAAASCGWQEEEHTAVVAVAAAAADTEADIGAEVAYESNQCSVEEASAGSWWLAAGSLVPSLPCWDGEEGLATSCWHWRRNGDVRPWGRQVLACQAVHHRSQVLACVVYIPPPRRTHPTPSSSCSHDASS